MFDIFFLLLSSLRRCLSTRAALQTEILEDVSEKPHARYGLDRLLRRTNRDLPVAIRLSHALP